NSGKIVRPPSSRRLPQQAAQHVLQDAAVPEVFDLVERIDAADHLLLAHAAIRVVDAHRQLHARPDPGGGADDVDRLLAGQLQTLAADPVAELQWQHPHADQVRAVDALEALDDDRLHPE